jgi:DNA polymerase-3 subunit epsilon
MWRLRLRRWQAARRREVSPVLRRYWRNPLPSPTNKLRDTRFLACDGEMTGLDPRTDELVSLGWVGIRDGEQCLGTGEHHLVRSAGSVGVSATVHQLRDCELAAGESLQAVLERFLEVAAGCVLVFHHAPLDSAFLDLAGRRLFGAPLLLPMVDTLWLEQRRLERSGFTRGPGDLRLQACRERYGLPAHGAHNALTDAVATGELLLAHVASRGPDLRLRDLMPPL